MNYRVIFNTIGKVAIVLAILLAVPTVVAASLAESAWWAILTTAGISLVLGLTLTFAVRPRSKAIFSKEGLVIVALSWIYVSAIGALPFVISGMIPNYIDAFFETCSGFSTTGATILSGARIDELYATDKGLLFWRSFTHFLGGMGVLAFVMAIIPLSSNDKSMHVLKAEMPGPSVAKLVPSLKKTLFYLYFIYLSLTVIEIVLLLIGGLDVFDSILVAFSTAGTGGFAPLNSSLATYSLFNKYVVAIFMFLFGINFNIYFLILMKNIKTALKSEELKTYLIIFVSAILIILVNSYQLFNNLFEAFTQIFFHTSSIISSTGFSIGDINILPTTSRIILICLMLISACAGSTCGGFKITRLIIVFKTIKRDFLKLVHPNSVYTITYEDKKVDEDTIKNTCTFMFLYFLLILGIMFIVSFDGFDLETTINAVAATFANVGLCFNISDFYSFSSLSKITLSIGMLLGRLEIFPIIVLFTNLRLKK